MASKLLFALSVILVVFLVGGGFGIIYQTEKNAGLAGKADVLAKLTNKTVSSIVAYGEVAKIEGRNITITYSGDSLPIFIKPDAKIFVFNALASPKDAVPLAQQEGNFSQIKMGDNVNVNISVSPAGQIEGFSVIVLPPSRIAQ